MKGILTAEKVGPFAPFLYIDLKKLTDFKPSCSALGYGSFEQVQIHSISDYLEVIQKVRGVIGDKRIWCIESEKKRYSSPKEKDRLEENLKRIEREYKEANRVLDDIPSRIIPLYQEVVQNCEHRCLFSTYNKGLIYSLTGQWDESLEEIRSFIDLAE
jgi:hypothetical protein